MSFKVEKVLKGYAFATDNKGQTYFFAAADCPAIFNGLHRGLAIEATVIASTEDGRRPRLADITLRPEPAYIKARITRLFRDYGFATADDGAPDYFFHAADVSGFFEELRVDDVIEGRPYSGGDRRGPRLHRVRTV